MWKHVVSPTQHVAEGSQQTQKPERRANMGRWDVLSTTPLPGTPRYSLPSQPSDQARGASDADLPSEQESTAEPEIDFVTLGMFIIGRYDSEIGAVSHTKSHFKFLKPFYARLMDQMTSTSSHRCHQHRTSSAEQGRTPPLVPGYFHHLP